MENQIIGICGVARAGKDTFCNIATDRLVRKGHNVSRFAFADALKNKIDPFLEENFGISAFTTNTQEKDIIRPLLVGLGASMRAKDPDYWIKQIAPEVEESLHAGRFVFITDVRYKNEIEWVHSLKGKTVYVSREGVLPANHEEEVNNVFVEELAKFKIHWDTVSEKDYMKYCEKYVSKTLTAMEYVN